MRGVVVVERAVLHQKRACGVTGRRRRQRRGLEIDSASAGIVPARALALLPETVQFCISSDPLAKKKIPPPRRGAVLLVMVQLRMVSVALLLSDIAPPLPVSEMLLVKTIESSVALGVTPWMLKPPPSPSMSPPVTVIPLIASWLAKELNTFDEARDVAAARHGQQRMRRAR